MVWCNCLGRVVLVWYDSREQLEVNAFVQGSETNYASKNVARLTETLNFSTAIGFHHRGIVVG